MKRESYCLLEGDVQGVGLRYWIMQEALKKQWKGFVRNLANGHVELVVSAPVQEKEIRELLQHAKCPGRFESITITAQPMKDEYVDFQILR